MAFAGVSLIVDGKLCDSTLSPFDADADSGYHLLVVQGYSRTKGTTPNGFYISSRPFLVGGHRWIVKYYPNGKDDDNDNEEFMSLMLVPDDDEGIEVQYEFSFIDEPELQVAAIIRQKKKIDIADWYLGYTRFMRNEALERSRHLKNDSFVIRCDIVVIKADNNTETEEHPRKKRKNNTEQQAAGTSTSAPVLIQFPPSDMQSHLSNHLLTKEGADITFEVGGKKFAAHRFMLAARSTVFKAQLFGAMDEGATAPSVLKINDIEANVFSELLAFIYTDAVAWYSFMEENEGDEEERDDTKDDGAEATKFALNLLEAAVRYDLQKLKIICEERLASYYLIDDSVADIIVVAERRGCSWLKDICLEFIKSHTSVHKVFTADCLDQIIRTTSPSGLKELFSKFSAS